MSDAQIIDLRSRLGRCRNRTTNVLLVELNMLERRKKYPRRQAQLIRIELRFRSIDPTEALRDFLSSALGNDDPPPSAS